MRNPIITPSTVLLPSSLVAGQLTVICAHFRLFHPIQCLPGCFSHICLVEGYPYLGYLSMGISRPLCTPCSDCSCYDQGYIQIAHSLSSRLPIRHYAGPDAGPGTANFSPRECTDTAGAEARARARTPLAGISSARSGPVRCRFIALAAC
jgi:hypothetical protein